MFLEIGGCMFIFVVTTETENLVSHEELKEKNTKLTKPQTRIYNVNRGGIDVCLWNGNVGCTCICVAR